MRDNPMHAKQEFDGLLKTDPDEEEFVAPKTKREVFKKPASFMPRKKLNSGVPGFRLDPKKWKRYDLSTVGDTQLSERSNKEAALSFLRSLRESREKEQAIDEDDDDACPESKKHVFKRPIGSRDSSVSRVSKFHAKRSNVIEATTEQHVSKVDSATNNIAALIQDEVDDGDWRQSDARASAKLNLKTKEQLNAPTQSSECTSSISAEPSSSSLFKNKHKTKSSKQFRNPKVTSEQNCDNEDGDNKSANDEET